MRDGTERVVVSGIIMRHHVDDYRNMIVQTESGAELYVQEGSHTEAYKMLTSIVHTHLDHGGRKNAKIYVDMYMTVHSSSTSRLTEKFSSKASAGERLMLGYILAVHNVVLLKIIE